MYVIRKITPFNIWMVVYPDNFTNYASSWQRCMDEVNAHINYNFYPRSYFQLISSHE